MGDSVGIRTLQQHASAVVSRAVAGEVVEITDRGRPVAALIPLASDRLTALVSAGLARPARRRLRDLPQPVSAPPGAPSLSQLLAQARDSER
jgi:prevent-host-death family protein